MLNGKKEADEWPMGRGVLLSGAPKGKREEGGSPPACPGWGMRTIQTHKRGQRVRGGLGFDTRFTAYRRGRAV